MTFETALYSYLSNFAGLAALVSTRIYPRQLPQNSTLPAVVYQRISGPRVHAMGSDPGITYPRYQFTCHGTTPASAEAVSDQIRRAFQNYSGTMGGVGGVTVHYCESEDGPNDYDPTTNSYRSVIDVEIWHGE